MLEKQDYKILRHIARFEKVHISEILSQFPENQYATQYRLNKLSKIKYSGGGIPIPDSSYIVEVYEEYLSYGITDFRHTGEYRITALGRAELQDKNARDFDFWRKEFMRSIFFPMLVAALTTVITIWITSPVTTR